MLKIAVASGKGGTGKTFVSTNLYRTMRKAGKVAGLVDCDAEVPNANLFLKGKGCRQWAVNVFCPSVALDKCTHCGACAAVCHFHAITSIPAARYTRVMPDLCHSCTACLHFCEEAAIVPGEKTVGVVTAYDTGDGLYLIEAKLKEGEHSPVKVIREAVGRGEQSGWDYLLLDAPPGCACPFVNTVLGTDLVVLVTEPTPFGLSDLKHTVKVLRQLEKPFCVVINRADLGGLQLKDYLTAEKIGWIAEIPYSASVAAAYSRGELAVDVQPEFSWLFTDLMDKILQYENRSH